jgi:methyl-accepting chemotaxis protein
MNIIETLNNIRIGNRLIGGFIVVTLLMASIGVIGFFGMNSISIEMDKVYSDGTIPLLEVTTIETSLNSIRALVFRTATIPQERDQDRVRMDEEMKKVDDLIATLKTRTLAPAEVTNLDLFEKQWTDYKAAATNVFTLLNQGKQEEAIVAMANGGTHANARRATVDTFNTLKDGILLNAENIAAQGHAEKEKTIPMMITIGIIAVIIALAFAVFLTRSITGPLAMVIGQFKQMSEGFVSGRLNLARKDEIGQMASMFDQFSDYLEHDVVGTMHQIAQGDLSAHVQTRGEKDQITPALTSTLTALNQVISELNILSHRASAGDLTVRGQPGNLMGSYREILIGFNSTLDALINPLTGAINLSKSYADCNFTARFPESIKTEGDFQAFRQALNAIGSDVSSALLIVERQMNDLADHAIQATSGIEDVKRGAGIIAANADQTRSNAEQSEEGISQVLRAMEDLTSTVASVSTNVEAVAQAGAEADQLAKSGILAAATAEEGMSSIRKSSAEVEEIIRTIQGQMTEITKIIGIITAISEQTNLLALNAAIEAARAGDAGLGFAVVAGEVKALANQTGESAQKIATMISGLETQSKKAVTAMDGAGEAIQQGALALQDTVNAFTHLTTAVEEISRNMSSVAGATEEQAASFEEITASINEMNTLIKETAKDALNSSATAEEALTVVDQITTIINEINEVVDTTSEEMKRFTIN